MLIEDKPTGFSWLSEDRRRAELDRRAERRATPERRRDGGIITTYALGGHQTEQERIAEHLRAAGMTVR